MIGASWENFFKDLCGVQKISQPNLQGYSLAEHEFDRLERNFRFASDINVGEGLLHLKFIKDLVRKQIISKVRDEGPVEELICAATVQLVQEYMKKGTVLKEVFSKTPVAVIDRIISSLEFIVDKLSTDFFDPERINYEEVTIDPRAAYKKPFPLFYVPLKENIPEIDEISNQQQQKDDFSLLYNPENGLNNEPYQLEMMFEVYREFIPHFSYNEFKTVVQREFASGKSDDEIMNTFLEMFGYDVVQFLSEIIRNRHNIDYSPQVSEMCTTAPVRKRHKIIRPQTIAGQVTVQSEKESILSKKLRKLEKKDKNNLTEVKQTEAEYAIAREQPLFKKAVPQKIDPEEYPHVHDQLRNHMITTKYDGVDVMQPENAVKKVTADYAEFTIPGGTKGECDDMELVQIKSLDPTGQLVFRDIKELNRVQSEVFPVAYHSNENILVCAPTGAGKTNIALLTIVHQILNHMSGNVIMKNDFKIVYVCPMKALATEMVANFSKKLAPIGITVKECTGDMQLSKKEILETQMLVTTPEKWDVITRKGAVDTEIVGLLKLLIIDEVHLLNGSRGPVIEALVARTLRQVISSQSMIRIVALSATLPGYLDVATFLKVNPRTGLFFFDNRFRSVPLTTTFIGVKKKNEIETMDNVCYEKVAGFVKEGHQAMVFVTSRNATANVARKLIEIAQMKGALAIFEPEKTVQAVKSGNYKSEELNSLVPKGFGIHHAGMVRPDRLEMERLFRIGYLKVIVCTTTLAWGVNLPAHAVIIRGTLHYDATKSTFVDMDMLDVMQIFGRAGRPQFDTSGHGIIITSMPNMSKYMGLLTSQVPIESQFLTCVPDNLNAEIVLGTVSNLNEATEWLANTFLYCRIKKNPLVYGLTYNEIWDSSQFHRYLHMQIETAAKTLEKSQMIRYDETLGEFRPTSFGRIASFYYISYKTMELFYEKFHRHISEKDLLQLLCEASEFEQIQVRMDEIPELDRLRIYNEYNVTLDFTHVVAKVAILIQTYISRAPIRVSSLASDSMFIMQTVTRLARALFEIARDKDYALQVGRTLQLAQMLELQVWDDEHPLMQFKELVPQLSTHRIQELLNMPIYELKEMSDDELKNIFRSKHVASRVKHYCQAFPTVDLDVTVKPITDGVIRVRLLITPNFKWDNSIHGTVQHYYAYVEDPTHDSIYHMETFVISKRLCVAKDPVELVFTVPLTKPLSLEYFVRVVNSQFIWSDCEYTIDLQNLKLFTSASFQTKVLDITPLPKSVLRQKSFEDLYSFTHFNSIQSQVFHSCYYTDTPIILGAPTGSGKTIVSELCILRQFLQDPQLKVVYIAPMKALVRERVLDWSEKFAKINKKVVEVTGDITPRSELIKSANIIITTPEKWDAMSRNYVEKEFVRQVGLVIIDEIHLLGEDRGPVLEVIVSRMNCINNKTNKAVRIVGLSTAMANPGDLAYWLGCDKRGLFNFSSAVRPVPLEIHLQGFDVKHYCPRMAAMNKSVFQAINQYAPESAALIFVSSRKQTRITGYELMKLLLSENNPQKWLHIDNSELELVKSQLIDQDLCQLMSFGIGMHHAGLTDNDRQIVEKLYVEQKIQVLIATATLAWGVNFPARLVVVKGTEYFDGATKRYVDMPVTDVIQMCGRAGRPQFDTTGYACVFVQENKKGFYRKFLFEPFPVESNLLAFLPDHVNAEIANGNITTKSQLIEFIHSTFFYRRLLANPAYYQLENDQFADDYVSDLADSVVQTLQENECVMIQDLEEMKNLYEPTFLGLLASQYYLSYKTVYFLSQSMQSDNSIDELLDLICQVEEYALFPVRHNEDNINRDIVRDLGIKTTFAPDSAALKILVMIKCYLLEVPLPNQDYVIDLKNCLDQIIRIIHAMMSLAANRNWLDCTLKLINFCQILIQGYLLNDSNLLVLPGIDRSNLRYFYEKFSSMNLPMSIPLLRCQWSQNKETAERIISVFEEILRRKSVEAIKVFNELPVLTVRTSIRNLEDNSNISCHLNDCLDYYNLDGTMGTNCLFQWDIYREGAGKMNVHSKKFNKQKEEVWFLIFVIDSEMYFRKFSFSKKLKTIEMTVRLPQKLGTYNLNLYVMSDCYVGFDQKLTYKLKIVN